MNGIPPFNPHGLLPPGIFDCSFAQLQGRFGKFQESDRRPRLAQRLAEFVAAVQKSRLFDSLLIDGSFVTAKPAPNDIDLVAVLRPGHDFERDLPMSEYTLVSRALLRRRFGFDVLLAEQDSLLYQTYVEFFSRVREAPNLRKGLVRLRL